LDWCLGLLGFDLAPRLLLEEGGPFNNFAWRINWCINCHRVLLALAAPAAARPGFVVLLRL
jgi:hypothetical protein